MVRVTTDNMEFLSEELTNYIEAHTAAESKMLYQINRDTHVKVMMPRMLSGHLQGRILATFSQMIRPANILEIGTYTGYSALCMLEGLTPAGQLITIDINEELEDMVRNYFTKAGVNDMIDFRVGDAMEIVPALDKRFQLVFIDADKMNYSNYFDMVIEKVDQGGFIIADNVLWSGKVVSKEKVDKDTQALINFNDKVHIDGRVENVLFPVRDGLMVMRKI